MADTDNKETERPPIDVVPSAIHQIEPTWRTDGYGVRGPQDARPTEKAGPTPMSFESSYPHQNSDGSGGSTSITVVCGSTEVEDVKFLLFDPSLFSLDDLGGGIAQVNLITTDCST